MAYLLHYAPDNASLVIRLALELGEIPYSHALVDRRQQAQASAEYRAINPQGQIPALITAQGALFETGAILTWLTETHSGLGPTPGDPLRGRFLSWLFVISNTLHASLRKCFYPEKFIAAEQTEALRAGLRPEINRVLAILEMEAARGEVLGGARPNVADLYLGCCLRWGQLYPAADPVGIRLDTLPNLHALALRLDTLPATLISAAAEGLGPTPFSRPIHCNPPEGSAV